ncbi:hypothetical protein GTP46_27985 [Duganella sp. FT135W]|uniref:Uncharacterized protein n=1 Tax=Duganella flavida TaxID=2692175 RepID=A0A6L8KG89_9BURK|nr:hypothetical protein [Duganella flavida]MYM26473.1 hypothetical protein [Duganella flavida]
MSNPIDFDLVLRRQALDNWLAETKKRMTMRFSKIDFEADHWPIRTLYGMKQPDWHFTEPLADFAAKDVSYREALRCLVAEMVIAGNRNVSGAVNAFRMLASAPAHSLFDLTLQDLRKIESDSLDKARANPGFANRGISILTTVATQTTQLGAKGVLARLGFHIRAEVKAELRKIAKNRRADRHAEGGYLLDRKVEAFSDALNALIDNDPRLSVVDRLAIAAHTRALCAPSRINEILCSSIDDHVTVNDYVQKPIGELDAVHRAHQMLLVTMKGSKGAEWSAKPVLNFMIDAFHYTTGVVLEHGKRSRMLVEWYQKHPTTLYLPPELEYLRGQNLSRVMLAKIILLTENPPPCAHTSSASRFFSELKTEAFKAPNPVLFQENGRRTSRPVIDFLPWDTIEKRLLKRVHQALAECRKVTQLNHYEGDLSKMLFLFDPEETPYLPHAINYHLIRTRFKLTDCDRNQTRPPTLFEKLRITMPVNGKIQIAELDTHDPRKWLTTMALIHGEKLSDVLINKWANRCRLAQLKFYDFRTAENLAEFSKMPEPPRLNELADLSNGLAAVEKLEDSFGLKTAIVTAHDVGIAMSSMDLIVQASENRPIAKSSRGIIIIYPQRFGVCFHQHHEKPCRNYSNSLVTSCVTCNEAAYVKGHIPTNDETRKVARQVFSSIVRHLENLAHTHNRGIADDQDALGEHMLTLAEKGMSPSSLEQLATHLIEEFHQIKHLIKDKLFARRLEEAFVTREVVKILDDTNRPSGSFIKYRNPTQHADSLLEVALDSHGGRDQVARDEKKLVAKYPQFAPTALGLKDERHLVEPDDREEGD